MDKQQHKIRILYLLYGESLLFSGILRSQVRQMLERVAMLNTEIANKNQDPSALIKDITILSFINPLSFFKHHRQWRDLRRELGMAGLNLQLRPLLAPLRLNWLPVLISMKFCLILLCIHMLCARFHIIHSRSYGAGLLGSVASNLFGCAHIFDPRGPMPEEMVINNFWRAAGWTYRIWKKLEQKILTSSAAVVAVTPYFKRIFLESGARKVIFIPNRVKTQDFKRDSSTEKALASGHNYRKTLLFIGEMDSKWYPPELVAEHYQQLKKIVPSLKLVIYTHKDRNSVIEKLTQSGIAAADVSVNSAAPAEMASKIRHQGLGLILGLRPTGNWPVKYGEYLAAGVPVAVEQEVGDPIVKEVRKWKLGMVLDSHDPDSYLQLKDIFSDHQEYSERCRDYAFRRLDLTRSAQQYLKLYKQVSSYK